jgi:EAL domain-containing protein (putative c-di-GMP-specific phosphodiesterase class I)
VGDAFAARPGKPPTLFDVSNNCALDESVSEGEHYELLVRMRDDDGGLIPPGLFLPAAERYNLIGHIERWMVRHVFDAFVEKKRAIGCLAHVFDQSLRTFGVQ